MQHDSTSLDALVDIVVPSPAPWWPPAPGWYLVLGAILVVGAWQLIRAWQRWLTNAYRRAALAEVDHIAAAARTDPQAWGELPAILKRTALSVWPRDRVASLAGDDWLKFLDQSIGDRGFTAGPGRLIVDLTYNPAVRTTLSTEQASAVLAISRRWIEHHKVEREPARC